MLWSINWVYITVTLYNLTLNKKVQSAKHVKKICSHTQLVVLSSLGNGHHCQWDSFCMIACVLYDRKPMCHFCLLFLFSLQSLHKRRIRHAFHELQNLMGDQSTDSPLQFHWDAGWFTGTLNSGEASIHTHKHTCSTHMHTLTHTHLDSTTVFGRVRCETPEAL